MASHGAGKRGLTSLVKIASEKGLVSDVVKVGENLTGASTVPLPLEMSKWLTFKSWTSFDRWIEESQKKLTKKLREDKCLTGGSSGASSSTSSQSPSACDGTFRHSSCSHSSCEKFARFKELVHRKIQKRHFQEEADFYIPTGNMLQAMQELVHRIDPKLSYMVKQNGNLDTLRLKRPDFQIRPEPMDHDKKAPERSPKISTLFPIEVKYPRIKLNQLKEAGEGSGGKALKNSPENVATSYNKRFEEAVSNYESNGEFRLDALHRAVIQTNFYGLSVQNGLSVLWTHNDAVLFRAQPRIKSGRVSSIDVLTSKVYYFKPRGDEPSSGDALLALMMYAPLVNDMHDFDASVHILSKMIQDEKDGKKKKEKKEEPSSSDTHAKGSSSSAQKQEDKKDSQKKSKKRQVPFIDRFMSQLIMENLGNLPNRFKNMSKEEMGKVLRGLGKDKFLDLNVVEMETMFVQHYEEMIAVGSSGKVLLADVGGLAVAIKKWNMDSDWGMLEDGTEALEALQNEVYVYKMLAQKFPELLGEVVPRAYAVLEEPEEETTLVTEYVGDKLVRHILSEESVEEDRYEWYVNGELLTEKDEMQVNEAATKAIWELHKRGIWHSDYRDPNLRVQRIIDDSGEPNWRVWWIDFGIARIREGEKFEPMEWRLGSPDAL